MNIAIIFNMITILLMYIFPNNTGIEKFTKDSDEVLMYFFLAEQVLKIIGNFPTDYLWDKWNIFDLILVVSNLLIDVGLSAVRIIRSLKFLRSLRMLKIAKIQRAFWIFRSIWTFKFTKYLKRIFKKFEFINWIY